MQIKLAENFRAVFYAPFYATHALGFYAREGVEVELLSSPAPAAAASSLYDGSIDISWGRADASDEGARRRPEFAAHLLSARWRDAIRSFWWARAMVPRSG